MGATREALLLSALLFQRPGNIRAMEWASVDFDEATLTIPAASVKRTKDDKENGKPHCVPLAPQALASLKRMHGRTGHGRYVFPSMLSGERPMSDTTINVALRRTGQSAARRPSREAIHRGRHSLNRMAASAASIIAMAGDEIGPADRAHARETTCERSGGAMSAPAVSFFP